jgi:hypothetical protein
LLGQHTDFLDGKATLKLITLETGSSQRTAPPDRPHVDRAQPAPSARAGILAMNFAGNHTLTQDPRVPLTRGWVPSFCKGCTNNGATDASRGTQSPDWPISVIVQRGYALAAFYSGDVDPDRAEVSEGLYKHLANGEPARNSAADRGR